MWLPEVPAFQDEADDRGRKGTYLITLISHHNRT
jgi:hypothetical protein